MHQAKVQGFCDEITLITLPIILSNNAGSLFLLPTKNSKRTMSHRVAQYLVFLYSITKIKTIKMHCF
jgi:hypothetical protein